ncbi:MAG: hypothetical protein KA319_00885 [Ferruginibacter sp.]|nr:hypothetical protein [Ferruginibacter sp.]
MSIKKCISVMLLFSGFFTNLTKAQSIELEEKKVIVENGFEYGYLINNEQTKSVKGDEYSRYEITLFIKNKTGCTKLIADKEKFSISEVDPNKLAFFDCLNATGKRFTTKKASVDAKDFYVRTKIKIGDKEETKSVKVGYIFKNGETLRNNIIVIVPLNERPKITCKINSLMEL